MIREKFTYDPLVNQVHSRSPYLSKRKLIRLDLIVKREKPILDSIIIGILIWVRIVFIHLNSLDNSIIFAEYNYIVEK